MIRAVPSGGEGPMPPEREPQDKARPVPVADQQSPPQPETGPTPLLPRAKTAPRQRKTDPSGELSLAIGVLRSRIDEEFRITETLNAKQRQAFALAVGFFALVQAVAFGSFLNDQIEGKEPLALALFALLAALLLGGAAIELVQGEKPMDEDDLPPDWIVDAWRKGAREPFGPALLKELSVTAQRRNTSNQSRKDRVERVQMWAAAAAFVSIVELLVGIVIRVN